MNTLPQSPTKRRHFFDVVPLFAVAIKCWRENGSRCNVRVDQVIDEDLPRVWTHPETVFRIINRFVTDSIESSIEGGVVEVGLRVADPDGDWIAFTIRDWAGGKPEGWTLDPSTQQLAKQMDGYVDVANHPGRSTVYSLHLPTGSLAGWLCRQSPTASGYFISWDSPGGSNAKSDWAIVDEAIQMSVQSLGSLVPSGDNAYLLASSSPIDKRALEAAISERITMNILASSATDIAPVRVEYFGMMGDFMRRLESSIPTSTLDAGWDTVQHEPGAITRIDAPMKASNAQVDLTNSLVEPPKRPTHASPSGARMRPRRVRAI